MAEEIIDYQTDLDQLIDADRGILAATSALWKSLNDIIGKYQLQSLDTLLMLSHLSAAYVHKMQTVCTDAESRDAVEDQFHQVMDCYLAAYDQDDINREMKRMMS